MNVAFKECNQIIGSINSAYHKAAKKMNLPDSEMGILYVLSSYPDGCKQSTLYKETGFTKSTIHSALKKLEKNGMLCITPGDGRNTWVCATAAGKTLIARTVSKLVAIENEIYASWTHEQQQLFLQINRDFARQLHQKISDL